MLCAILFTLLVVCFVFFFFFLLLKVGFLDRGPTQSFRSNPVFDLPPYKSQWKDQMWLNKRNVDRKTYVNL